MQRLVALGGIGWPEIVLIVVIAVLIFGARKLPEIGRGMGKGIREFREGLKDGDGEKAPDEKDPEPPRTGDGG
jgi:sec-independent protein translocase protein TatA